ncbi:MAG TPA: hypothetical protein PLO86_12465, partial [Syntrophales bacterium]|nr:hypothetical protein [Syntrophales bacterium]
TLTSRDKGKEDAVPLCGFPWHAAAGYIAKLIGRGFKVAICEQVEDPREAKGIVRREVIRVVTPGLVLDPANLSEKENNYFGPSAAPAGPRGSPSWTSPRGSSGWPNSTGRRPWRTNWTA